MSWKESRCLHVTGNDLLAWRTLNFTQLPLTRGRDLADWNRLWERGDAGSIQSAAFFVGGDLRARATVELAQLTAEDFRLRTDSAGFRAGPDGKDLGADIDLVGPGKAFERWKRTPEYQRWLRATGRVK